MAVTVVRYRTKPDRTSENQVLIERVFAALQAAQPAGLQYASFRLADGVSFVHVAATDTVDGANPLAAVPAFAEFVRDIADRCDEPPSAQDATVVGAYGFFGVAAA